MSQTKKDIAIELAERYQLTQVDTKNLVQGVFDLIIEVLRHEGRIELRDFGVFEVKTRKPRKARNPKTGDAVLVPQRKVVSFRPGRDLARRVEQGDVSGLT